MTYKCTLFLLIISITSCIRDNSLLQCPPLRLSVKILDKNYQNIEFVNQDEIQPEYLLIKDYVDNYICVIEDMYSGEVVWSTNGIEPIIYSTEEITINLPDSISHGDYVITTWAGISMDNFINEQDFDKIKLLPDQINSSMFLSKDTVKYRPFCTDFDIGLKRAKGKLILDMREVSHIFNKVNMKLDNIAKYLICDQLQYVDTLSVIIKDQEINDSYLKYHISPSLNEDISKLQLNLMGVDSGNLLSLDVDVSIHRNNITVVKLSYDDFHGVVKVSVLIDSEWDDFFDIELE